MDYKKEAQDLKTRLNYVQFLAELTNLGNRNDVMIKISNSSGGCYITVDSGNGNLNKLKISEVLPELKTLLVSFFENKLGMTPVPQTKSIVFDDIQNIL